MDIFAAESFERVGDAMQFVETVSQAIASDSGFFMWLYGGVCEVIPQYLHCIWIKNIYTHLQLFSFRCNSPLLAPALGTPHYLLIENQTGEIRDISMPASGVRVHGSFTGKAAPHQSTSLRKPMM
jgi:hypothetical protein